STSHQGLSVVVVQFLASADVDKSIADLKSEIDKIKPDLPTEAKDPSVTEVNITDSPVLLISVAGDYSPEELTSLGDTLKDDLKAVKGVARVDVSGVRAREVQVVVDQAKLDQYGLRLIDVVAAVESANTSLPLGSIAMDGINYALQFNGDIEDPAEVNDIALLSQNGNPVYVRDVAHVVNGLEDPQNYSRVSQKGEPSTPSLTLSIFKSSGGNIVNVANAVKA